MTIDMHTIRPGLGLGDLQFGMTRDEVRDLAGPPSEMLASEAAPGSEVWIYEAHAVALSFAADEDLRFVSAETFSRKATLHGQPLVGLSRDDASAALERAGTQYEWLDDEEGAGSIVLPGQNVQLWVEEGAIDSVSFAVLFDDEDNAVWPEGQLMVE